MSGIDWRRQSDVPGWRDRGWKGRLGKMWQHLGAVFYNSIGTHIPSHVVRLTILRIWGARIGPNCSILKGTTILAIGNFVMGSRSTIGFRCMLDARFGLEIGSNVAIASDCHFIGGKHDIESPTFEIMFVPVVVEDYAWIASRATVFAGRVGRGAVVGACSLVYGDVPELTVVGGVPAVQIGTRPASALQYDPTYRPRLF